MSDSAGRNWLPRGPIHHHVPRYLETTAVADGRVCCCCSEDRSLRCCCMGRLEERRERESANISASRASCATLGKALIHSPKSMRSHPLIFSSSSSCFLGGPSLVPCIADHNQHPSTDTNSSRILAVQVNPVSVHRSRRARHPLRHTLGMATISSTLPGDQAGLDAPHVSDSPNSEDISEFHDAERSPAQVVTPPESPRSYSPHPLEAHLRQLEEYEIERPPFYNKSTLAPDLIFSVESLRHEAKNLARILLSFMAYAIHTHGTTNSCDIGIFGRFELWPNRPPEANSMAATVLNEKNIVYTKALRYAERDLEERGLYIKRFAIRQDKKRQATIAEWSIQMTPVAVNQQYPHHSQPLHPHRPSRSSAMMGIPTANELVRMHHEAYPEYVSASRPQSRTQHRHSDRNSASSSGAYQRSRSGAGAQGMNRLARNNDYTNEFGYYGNKCLIM